MLDLSNIKYATGVAEVKLVGVRITKYPLVRGNCFRMYTKCGGHYRILNFVYENLEYLLKNGLSYPIKIAVLNDREAVVHDERIPDNFYTKKLCNVCSSEEFKNNTDYLAYQRGIMSGRI